MTNWIWRKYYCHERAYVSQCREQEEKELQHEFLCGSDANLMGWDVIREIRSAHLNVTFTSSGSNQKTFILMILMIKTTASTASTAFLLKNFSAKIYEHVKGNHKTINSYDHSLIFFPILNSRPLSSLLPSSSVFGIYSNFAIMPLPSIDLGEILNVAPLNIISGICTSILCVTKNLTPLSYRALDTSSIGAA